MARVNKILSNIVGLTAARETCQGLLTGDIDPSTGVTVVPSVPPIPVEWKNYEPNTYAASGATITTTAPNPINATRQRNKGLVTDLEATLGFNHDLSPTNMADMFEAALFADTRFVAAPSQAAPANIPASSGILTHPDNASIAVGYRAKTATGSGTADGIWLAKTAQSELTLNSGSAEDGFIADLGIRTGDWIFIGGLPANSYATNLSSLNGFKRVKEVTDRVITFDKMNLAAPIVSKSDAGTKRIEFYFGNVLNNANQQGDNITDFRNNNTFQFERSLGTNDGTASGVQSELITGCVLNEVSINFPAQGLVNVDLGFVAKDQLLLDSTTTPVSPKTVNPSNELIANSDIFNTTSDISRMRMSKMTDGKIVPGDFFTYITEATITINNGVTPDKALSVLGSFDYSLGNFIVGGSVQAYFADVEAVRAVRENSDVTMDYILVKNNAGIVFDLPLITLGDGQLNVEIDQSVRIPLNTEAAKSAFGYTMKIVSFPYLPDLADTI